MKTTFAWCVLALTVSTSPVFAAAVDVPGLTKTIRAVGPQGAGHREATAAWKQLAQADINQLPQILAEMKGADVLATNWLRAAVEAIAERQIQAGGKLPVAALEAFLADTRQAPRARRLAYELVARTDDSAENRLIPPLANDPSVELRRDAVAFLLKAAATIDAGKQRAPAIAAYQQALAAARDEDQIKEASKKLKELGQPADLARHYGFLLDWKVIGPFDNSNKGGFNVEYPPEKAIDLSAAYEGKSGAVKWLAHSTTDEHGVVDLNKAIGKHMGAVGYAYAEFESAEARPVELRWGTPNGNKIWLNGELLTGNHVYHTGSHIDQYQAPARLKKGRNTILLKILQNEQTEEWAQDWQFQLRVCDSVGTAVLAVDRVASK